MSPTICAGTHGYAIGYIVVGNFSSGRKGEECMTQYTSEKYICSECNTEMNRDVSTMRCRSIDKTGDFYSRLN